jgi:hypothetical protein
MEKNSYSWTAPEFIFKEKTVDWYWAIGIITVSSVVAAIIFKNYLFAVLLVMGGFAITMLGKHKPSLVEFTIDETSIHAKGYKYVLEELKGYMIDTRGNNLVIETTAILMPVIFIPLSEDIDMMMLKSFLSKVDQKDIKEPPFEKVIEFLGL